MYRFLLNVILIIGVFSLYGFGGYENTCEENSNEHSTNEFSENENLPIPAACIPEVDPLLFIYGIQELNFGSLSVDSGCEVEDYEDLTASGCAELIAGQTYDFSVLPCIDITYLGVWIDFNDDGAFSSVENVYLSFPDIFFQTEITIPQLSPQNYGVPLRMRVRNTPYTNNMDPCGFQDFGQTVDYTVVIDEPLPLAPVAGFEASETLVSSGQFVQYQSTSQFFPESYEWYFEGGIPQTSTEANPVVGYSAQGSYDVRLIVQNIYGSDTLLIEDHIVVAEKYNICEDQVSTSRYGSILPMTSPPEPLAPEICGFLISPQCASKIKLSPQFIENLPIQSKISVYDGVDDNAPLLHRYLEEEDTTTVFAYSGQMFIEFQWNNFPLSNDWAFIWQVMEPVGEPMAMFQSAFDILAENSPIHFENLSTGFNADYLWDFGDGETSTLKNPVHTYSEAGNYQVSLTAETCAGSGQFTSLVTVGQAGQLSTDFQDTLHLTLSCAGADTVYFEFNNVGLGNSVVWGNTGWQLFEEPNILFPVTGLDAEELEWCSVFVDSLTTRGFPYIIDFSDIDINTGLEDELMDYDIVIFFPWFSPTDFFRPIVQDFVEQGGTVVSGVEGLGFAQILQALDVETINAYSHEVMIPTNIGNYVLPNFPEELSLAHIRKLNTTSVYKKSRTTDPRLKPFVTVNSGEWQDAVIYQVDYFNGHVLNPGIWLGELSQTKMDIYYGLMMYAAQSLTASYWLEPLDSLPYFATGPGSSYSLGFTVNTSHMAAGDYYETLSFLSNDPSNPETTVTVHLSLTEASAVSTSSEDVFFESILPGNTDEGYVVVENVGCTDLLLAPSLGTDAFSLSPGPMVLEPYESDTLFITFNPTMAGDMTTILSLNGDSDTTLVTLHATALELPDIDYAFGDTLSLNLDCGASLDTMIYLVNPSLGDLYLTGQVGQGADSLTVARIVLDDPFPNTSYDYYDDFRQSLADLNISWVDLAVQWASEVSYENVFAAHREVLEDVDVLIVRGLWTYDEEEYYGFYEHLNPMISDYLENGGNVLLMELGTRIDDFTFLPPYGDLEGFSDPVIMDLVDVFHPLAYGIDPPYVANLENGNIFLGETVYGLDLAGYDEWNTIFEIEGLSAVAEAPFGPGNIIRLGFAGSFNYAELEQSILRNAFNRLSGLSAPGWVDVGYDVKDTILPGDSLAIPLSIDGDSLSDGTHYHEVVFFNNIPSMLTDTIVIQLNLSGSAHLESGVSELDFGEVMLGDVRELSVPLTNSGCQELTVQGASTSDEFAFGELVELVGYTSDSVFISFTPSSLGAFEGLMQIGGGGEEIVLAMSGIGVEAPQLVLASTDYEISVNDCSDSAQVFIPIQNTGNAPLSINIEPIERAMYDVQTMSQRVDDHAFELLSMLHHSLHEEVFEVQPSSLKGDNYWDDDPYSITPGNFIGTSNSLQITYAQATSVIESDAFGQETSYSMTYEQGLFFMAADLNGVEHIRVTDPPFFFTSEYGHQGYAFDVNTGSVPYRVFVTYTRNSGRKTINRIFVLRNPSGAFHEFSVQGTSFHELLDVQNSDRLYYFHILSNPNAEVSEGDIRKMLWSFFDLEQPPRLSQTQALSGTLPPSGQTSISLYVQTQGLEEGIYTLPIEILSNDPGGNQTVNVELNVGDRPCADFQFLAADGCSGKLDLRSDHTNFADEQFWDFGDGHTAFGETTFHVYEESGIYEVTYQSCLQSDCSSINKTVNVTAGGPYPVACSLNYPSFYVNMSDLSIEEFSLGAYVNSGDDEFAMYEDFTCQDPMVLELDTDYEFTIRFYNQFNISSPEIYLDANNDGVLTVGERVFDIEWGLYGEEVSGTINFSGSLGGSPIELYTPLRLRVFSKGIASVDCAEEAPAGRQVEDYAVYFDNGVTEASAVFDIDESNSCEGEFGFSCESCFQGADVFWDFGDGTTASADWNPEHIYQTPGNYEVMLIVSFPLGADTSFQTINVPFKGIEDVLVPDGVVLTNQSIPLEAVMDVDGNLTWDFGDGTDLQSPEPIVDKVYDTSGIYPVSAMLDTDTVCYPSQNVLLTVNEINAEFDVDDSEVCDGNVVFNCEECFVGADVQWDFGDGGTSSSPNPVHTYEDGGVYEVVLTVGYDGISDTSTLTVNVPQKGIEELILPQNGVVGEPVEMQVVSDVEGDFLWDFYDGNTLEGPETTINHTFENEGFFAVSVATDVEGVCVQETNGLIQIGTLSNLDPDLLDVVVWPNPSKGRLFIECPSQFDVRGITDLSGRTVDHNWVKQSQNMIMVELNSSLSSGFYLLHLRVGDQVVVFKMALVR